MTVPKRWPWQSWHSARLAKCQLNSRRPPGTSGSGISRSISLPLPSDNSASVPSLFQTKLYVCQKPSMRCNTCVSSFRGSGLLLSGESSTPIVIVFAKTVLLGNPNYPSKFPSRESLLGYRSITPAPGIAMTREYWAPSCHGSTLTV